MNNASAAKQQISSAFGAVSHPPLGSTVLSRLAALATSLKLSPKQLADAWEAHSLTKGVAELNDATFKGYHSAVTKERGVEKNVTVIASTGLGKRKPGSNITPSPNASKRPAAGTAAATPGENKAGTTSRDGMSAVDNLTTPSGKGAASPSSKQQQQQPGSAASSASSAMVITPPKGAVKYADRTNAGQVVSSYNPHNLPSAAEVLASKSAQEHERLATRRGCVISYHPLASHPTDPNERHMFAPLEKRSAALEERLIEMSDAICQRYGIKSEDDEMVEAMDGIKSEKTGEVESLWTPVGLPKQNKVICVGRICNEAHEGRINRTSIRLEGSRQHSAGSRIQLNLDGLDGKEDGAVKQSYSFFPGQIVAVEGINSSGRTMQASRILEGAAPPRETMSAGDLMDYHHGAKSQDGAPLSIVSLCGPFTTRDNLNYDPLTDAIVNVMKEKPDVVIMCGPFVDGRHPMVAGGQPKIEIDGNKMMVSYELLFARKISDLLAEMYEGEPEIKTQFVLVPSMDDAFLDAVYPQPPLQDRVNVKVPKQVAGEFGDLGLKLVEDAGREKQKSRPKRVHCVSNPCTLQINDITVGVTSTDVLFHISSDVCNANLEPGTRLSRIAQHLVQQRSYYPLFPAAKGASLDLSKSKEWEMPVQPDILLVPSKLASFARKVLATTIVVNPGELTKNTTGGTYATIDVHPMKRETLEKGNDAGMDMGKGVQDRVRVDIKRI